MHRGLHFLSNAATDAYEKARETVRRFLNAPSVDEIVFTSNTTEAINTVAYGCGMPNIGEGDEIVLSIMEHHSNIVPWHFIRERQGAKLVWVPVDDDGVFHIEEFEKRLTDAHQARRDHPDVECAGHRRRRSRRSAASPMRAAFRCWSTAARRAVHMPVDVQDLDCDFYVFTGHKVYGPTGIGVLYGKKAMLEAMRPFQGGGEMIERGDRGQRHLQRSAAPLRGRHAADRPGDRPRRGARLHGEHRPRRASPRMRPICATMRMSGCASINSLRIFGDAPGKGAIVSFELAGHPCP